MRSRTLAKTLRRSLDLVTHFCSRRKGHVLKTLLLNVIGGNKLSASSHFQKGMHMDSASLVSIDEFRKGMQCLASGVCIIATGQGNRRNGFTATAVMSLSDQPPSLVVGVGKQSHSHDQIRNSGKFSVNLLQSGQLAIADMFAGRSGISGAGRFASSNWVQGCGGSPILEDALTVFECSMKDYMETDTHTLIIGLVTMITRPSEAGPLVYFRRDYNGVCQLDSTEAAMT
jgi:flavin reductase (DIM6/NTAB) family NADH-FMN oxidoreductase RutF